jgi:hypothetical protein
LAKSASYEAPHCAVFSSLLSFHPSLAQIYSSVSCFHIFLILFFILYAPSSPLHPY